MRLPRCVFTVPRLMCSSSAISELVLPRATVTSTSSSRTVSGAMGCAGGCPSPPAANAASSRTVTFGAISASPAAAACTAWTSSSGPASLSRNPRAPALQRAVHVLVEVERRDHDDRERVGDVRSGQPSRGLDAVHLGHPDVEQAHVGAQLARPGHRLAPVGDLRDHLDARAARRGSSPGPCGRSPGRRPRAPGSSSDRPRLAAAPRRPSSPRSAPGPASRVPPSRVARSVIPTSP